MGTEQKKTYLEKSGFKCQKCGYYSPLGESLEAAGEFVLCPVCFRFAPPINNAPLLKRYVLEKIDGSLLETFRKFNQTRKNSMKQGMIASARKGRIVSRPAFGYKMENGLLVPAGNKDMVREIFEAFADGASLNQIARAKSLSVNGIKKILKNFTYIGKVKFDSQILQGNHEPIILPELFNRVQKRFDKLQGKKSIENNFKANFLK